MLHSRGDKAMEKCHLDILLQLLIAILDTRASMCVRVGETLRSQQISRVGDCFFVEKIIYLAVPGLHCDIGILSCRMRDLVP